MTDDFGFFGRLNPERLYNVVLFLTAFLQFQKFIYVHL